ncbi:MAG: polymerase [Pusillimonas sp.]|nr:polymerase [Pusillimonas sp.]
MNKTVDLKCVAYTVVLLFSPLITLAQVAPDAGRVLQEELAQPPAPPRSSPGFNIQIPTGAAVKPGGSTVTLGGLHFEGNTLFSDEELAAVAGPLTNQPYDLADISVISDRLTQHYQQVGFPFARAIVPAQALDNGGVLQIRVVEGRYGKVSALSDSHLASQAQPYLSALEPGAVIESGKLERATLLLNDLPGIEVSPVIRPGAKVGTGDLDVTLSQGKRYSARVGLDNHGNYYSGQWRARAGLVMNSPFMLGDQISLDTLYTNEKLWLGQAMYSVPIGSNGLRGSVSYAQTTYSLANGFEGNEGTARIAGVGLGYPLLRSQQTNINLSATWQYKRLRNSYFYGAASERYHSTGLPVSIGFDHRDGFGGGGVTYGGLTWTYGNLHKNDPVRRGAFNKINFDLVRLQALSENFSLFARFSGQWANKNLDSSESMSLGGPNSVRAYPLGESSGDEGWLTQIELRYALGDFTPYVFYDYGRMKMNAKPNQVALLAPDETRAGAGFGLRYQNASWRVDGVVAWRTQGGAPTSDTHADPKPRLWLTATYEF